MPDGYIVRGHRHGDCFKTARDIPRYKKIKDSETKQGFVTSKNRFVDREEGLRLQLTAGIESAAKKHGQDYRSTELFSEDLY
jgi:hypothetical protein